MKAKLRDGSGERHYRHVTEDVDRHGNVRLYFRRKGQQKVRLKERPGTEAFDIEYQGIFASSPKPNKKTKSNSSPGSLRWLCEQYYKSAIFKGLDEKTRRRRKQILEPLCIKYGNLPYAMLEPKHISRFRDELAETPHAANARLKSLGAVFAWACDPENEHTRDNPVAKVKYLPSRNPDGHRTWTADDVAKYCAHYPIGTQERLAIDLLLYTGVRRGDLIRLGPPMERDGFLFFVEQKGRAKNPKPHQIPILAPLMESINATPIGPFTYLIGPRSKRPFGDTSFSQWFKARCSAAGIEAGLTPHGMRKLAAVTVANAGATDEQMRSLFGWTTREMASVYTRKANKTKLEAEAATLLTLRTNGTHVDVPPQKGGKLLVKKST